MKLDKKRWGGVCERVSGSGKGERGAPGSRAAPARFPPAAARSGGAPVFLPLTPSSLTHRDALPRPGASLSLSLEEPEVSEEELDDDDDDDDELPSLGEEDVSADDEPDDPEASSSSLESPPQKRDLAASA